LNPSDCQNATARSSSASVAHLQIVGANGGGPSLDVVELLPAQFPPPMSAAT
jgi:hypothetical protein